VKPLIYRSNQALLRGLNWLERRKSVLNLELLRNDCYFDDIGLLGWDRDMATMAWLDAIFCPDLGSSAPCGKS
jgi:hypothetical protein